LIYFRDPNSYVVELTAKMAEHDEAMNPATNHARKFSIAGRRQDANR
jgi:hypothetical protein